MFKKKKRQLIDQLFIVSLLLGSFSHPDMWVTYTVMRIWLGSTELCFRTGLILQ